MGYPNLLNLLCCNTYLADVDAILNGYCRTERCRNLITNNCYFAANTNRRPTCEELQGSMLEIFFALAEGFES